ncbi:helix-turn-helix domain-containing protein [Ammoniphilus sp. CFH 90114]|uniref:helix-turn-helix domain-containing protein n=1 Tax=Ammoniphilus sp. CFH 90114 TaxID=2493665 RepID=UPI00100F7B28|nr:helix-turn-helix domain-containing protein [Ammoniphilus sp. CFH 90114]RXT04574.1 GAF domain-containing protein [Ammoniphilus sp. CFH 90114]
MAIRAFTSDEKIHKLMEINKLLTKSLDLEVVLETLVKAAVDLIEVSDTIILYLYDPEDQVLRMAEGVGIDKSMMHHIAFRPGESLTGYTFTEKRPMLYPIQEDIQKRMATMAEQNYAHYLKGVYGRQVRSAFCVPLLYQERCLGVLAVDNFENEGIFTEDDMRIIEVVADQSAIAIVNSRLVQGLKEKNAQLTSSLETHQKFTQIILEGGGIEPILTLLGRILQGKVSYMDATELDDPYLFPIIREKEHFGSIRLQRPVASLSSIERSAVEHAGTALTLDRLKQNALYEKELHLRGELFHQLTKGSSIGQLKQMARQLKWDPNGELQCMVVEGRKESLWKPENIRDKETFIRSIEAISRGIHPNSMVFSLGYQIVVLVPYVKEDTMYQLYQSVDRKWGKAKDIVYGLGRKSSLSQVGNSFEEALEAARYAKVRNDHHFVSYSKLGAERLWQNLDPTLLEHYIEDKLGPLLTVGEECYETLAMLMECNKNHKVTAQRLHIHQNTLYYRLKKIEQILGVSIDNEVEWLNLVLAYQIFVSTHKK